MAEIQQLLDELVQRLKSGLGDQLISVVLYGSAASGELHDRYSDLNVFCLLRSVTSRELGATQPVVHWWREKGSPSPILMSEVELQRATDCFAIEFHDMQENRKVLYGADPFTGMHLGDRHYRAQIEYELRSKLIRLRQKAAGALQEHDVLLRLMADSVSTFCVLARHVLRLKRLPAPFLKRELLLHFEAGFNIAPAAFVTLLDLREGIRKPAGSEAVALLDEYIREIEAIIAAVDQLDIEVTQ